METSILLGLLDREAKNLETSNTGMSALLLSAAAKIRSLEAHPPAGMEATKGYSLEDVARLKREVDAGRGPGVTAEFGIPALRFS